MRPTTIPFCGRHFALGCVLLGSSLAGCVGSSGSQRHEQCEAICEKFYVCSSSNDAARCERRCEAESYWSEAYWKQRARCVDAATCDQLPASFNDLNGDVRVDDCIEITLRQQPLTDDQDRTCTSTATKLGSCDDSLDVDELRVQCSRGPVRQLDEDYVAESADCINLNTCSEIQQCLEYVVEDYSARVRLYDVDLSQPEQDG